MKKKKMKKKRKINPLIPSETENENKWTTSSYRKSDVLSLEITFYKR